jgi:hypothetical protein
VQSLKRLPARALAPSNRVTDSEGRCFGATLSRYDAAMRDGVPDHDNRLPQCRCGLFGVDFFARTTVIDREEKSAANLEGNRFTTRQLGDLVETVLSEL